jgi:hypothetical protein
MSKNKKVSPVFRKGKIILINDKQLRNRLGARKRHYILPGEIAVLHVWTPSEFERKRAPMAFRRSPMWGHLFGDDADELVRLAKIFGVRRPFVHRKGERGQHVDLCGAPLQRLAHAIKQCEGK